MNFFRPILILLCLSLGAYALEAQCSADEIKLTLDINADQYFYECSWFILSESGDTMATGAPTSDQQESYDYCLPSGACYFFQILDEYGDGINPGAYSLSLNDDAPFYVNSTGGYGNGERISFNCPPGTDCLDPIIGDLGEWTAPMGEAWYTFYPSDTGLYEVSTCFAANTCRTKIWVYDQCNPFFSNLTNNLGTLFYAEDGCASTDLAKAHLFLEGNKIYYIRIGAYDPENCQLDSLQFEITYEGAVAGCMDPTACNYVPLATLPDTCFYQGDPSCTDGPDLEINEPLLRQTFQLSAENNNDACEVFEGCTNGYGTRHKVRFSTEIANIGNLDYYIGQTPVNINEPDPNDQFVYDECHGHWHYRGYADYLLADSNGDILPIGSKNGFCVLDLSCSIGEFKYTCENMGITAGCEDEYDYTLPCQWIDITGIEAGQYTMICRVNWDQSPDQAGRKELDYSNNVGQVCFELSYNGAQPQVDILNDCPAYTDCEGTEQGSAARDCKGDCNGSALRGDLNVDTLRNDADLQQYLAHALNKDATAMECTDLHKDNKISLYDAALLNECINHKDEVAYWSNSFACMFPTGQSNPYDRHLFRLANLNTANNTFDIELSNNTRAMYGVDMTIDGVVIESIEEIHSSFDSVIIMMQGNEGRFLAFSPAEIGAQRTPVYRPLFRVKYSSLTNDTICIKQVDEVVNDLYELATPELGTSICVTDVTLDSKDGFITDADILAFPNPAEDKATIAFPGLEGDWAYFTLTNSMGQIVRTWKAFNNNREVMYRNNLPNGMYQLHVRTENGQGAIRLVFE